MSSHCISFDDVKAAHERVKPFVHCTPVLTNSYFTGESGRSGVYFKAEAFQKTGSFKFRGATNAVQSLSDEVAAAGVCTHSSGNHAQALSVAARNRGIPAHIIMPDTAPAPKQAAVRGYGANVTICSPTEREAECSKISKATGATVIHPSENPRVIAGQGTVSLELVEQVKEMLPDGEKIDVVIIPVGGGGLASGNSVGLRGLLGDGVKIVLAEPEIADDAFRSKAAGELLGHPTATPPNSVADGLKTTLGPNTWPIVRDLVDEIMTVSEAEIMRCTRVCWERMKVCIEPSAGTGLGVLLSDEFKTKYPVDEYKNVAVVLCGGNVDIIKFAEMVK